MGRDDPVWHCVSLQALPRRFRVLARISILAHSVCIQLDDLSDAAAASDVRYRAATKGGGVLPSPYDQTLTRGQRQHVDSQTPRCLINLLLLIPVLVIRVIVK